MKRILVTIVGQGSITHIIRSGILEGMRAFCEPVIGILWNEESLVEELRSKGYEVHIIPPYAANGEYNKLRTKINMWYIRKVLKTPSTRIQHNYFQQYTATKKNLKRRRRRGSGRCRLVCVSLCVQFKACIAARVAALL